MAHKRPLRILLVVLAATLLVALAFLSLMTVQPDLLNWPTYDGGPLQQVESEDNGTLLRATVDSHGVRHGPATYWRSGQKTGEGRFEHDRQQGPWSYWYEDGTLAMQLEYRAGQFHGPSRSWHANGRESERGTYLDGQESGLWLRWNEAGDLDRERSGLFEAGRRVRALLESELPAD